MGKAEDFIGRRIEGVIRERNAYIVQSISSLHEFVGD
jgi:hypothetical protein